MYQDHFVSPKLIPNLLRLGLSESTNAPPSPPRATVGERKRKLTTCIRIGAAVDTLLRRNALHRALTNRESRLAIRRAELLQRRNLLPAALKAIVRLQERSEAVLCAGRHEMGQFKREIRNRPALLNSSNGTCKDRQKQKASWEVHSNPSFLRWMKCLESLLLEFVRVLFRGRWISCGAIHAHPSGNLNRSRDPFQRRPASRPSMPSIAEERIFLLTLYNGIGE